ncbi:Cytochrome b6-f complex iron-sulfur subunit [Quillaja saponaria]|uniref:plastoquinol--plastocyanin reductase n=1 Tax=Quillaja saponaria TaxID=32244 RepID=A0AAD7QH39_QUISA|nr:Cytochrome b6-f complex iron-sulfur subunit [Quillaja saponaria]
MAPMWLCALSTNSWGRLVLNRQSHSQSLVSISQTPKIHHPQLPNMASSILSPATPSQLCSGKNGIFSSSQALLVKPTRTQMMGKEKGMRIACQASSISADRVPDMGKRKLMNLLLLGAISLPSAGMLVPYATFFAPPGSGGASGGTVAKDAIGNDIVASEWLKTHGPGDRTLTQGLKGDPTYLVVEKDNTIATYGINAVCTHLGCVVPWNKAENKFICPCHGSQYNEQGRVVRGPAPLSLALAHADINIDDGKLVFVPWVETDFRTGDAPWWA